MLQFKAVGGKNCTLFLRKAFLLHWLSEGRSLIITNGHRIDPTLSLFPFSNTNAFHIWSPDFMGWDDWTSDTRYYYLDTVPTGKPILSLKSMLSKLESSCSDVKYRMSITQVVLFGWLTPLQLIKLSSVQFSRVRLFATPRISAHQASLSSELTKVMSIESVMPFSNLILCHPLILLPPIPPSIRVFSNESTLRMRWPKYWSFSFSISPSSEHPGLISYNLRLVI